jgi:excisionase family DNA binding protein
MEQDLISLKEATGLLRISQSTIRRWTRTEGLPCIQIGKYGRIRIFKRDLFEFLEKHRHPPSAATRAKQIKLLRRRKGGQGG